MNSTRKLRNKVGGGVDKPREPRRFRGNAIASTLRTSSHLLALLSLGLWGLNPADRFF